MLTDDSSIHRRQVPLVYVVVLIVLAILGTSAFYQFHNRGSPSSSDGSLIGGGVPLQSVNGTIIGLNAMRIYNQTSLGVVTVTGARVTRYFGFFGPTNVSEMVLGSGFVVAYKGAYYVVTNRHVVVSDLNLTVTFSNGSQYPAQTVGSDAYSDIAVVRVLNVPKSQLHPLQLVPSSTLKVGEPVIAIGNPFGLSGSATFGIISQLGRTLPESAAGNFSIANIIQFSAPINPGNSGGPLLDAAGRVVGITTANVQGSEGVGFAIPSDTIIRELPYIISTGKYGLHSYAGILSANMNMQLAKAAGVNVTYGLILQSVVPNGPAAHAGLRGGNKTVIVNGQRYHVGGDIIVSSNGSRVVDVNAFASYLEGHTLPGQKLQLGIFRSGNYMVVTLVLGTRPPPPDTS